MTTDAEHFDVPVEDPRHRQIRDDAWMGGPLHEGRYYLGWFLGTNEFRSNTDDFLQRLDEVIRRELPQSAWLLSTVARVDFLIVWLKSKYRESPSNECFPIPKASKEEQAIVLLLQSPSLTNEAICERINASAKSLQRWSLFQYVRREMRMAAGKPQINS